MLDLFNEKKNNPIKNKLKINKFKTFRRKIKAKKIKNSFLVLEKEV